MNEPQKPSELTGDAEFQNLVRRKNTLSMQLSLLIFGVYFGFIALLAFAPQLLSARVGAATIGIPLGIGVIVFAWILTGIYVRWANGAYDQMVARVRQSKRDMEKGETSSSER